MSTASAAFPHARRPRARRLLDAVRAHAALSTAAAVLVLAWGGLIAVHRSVPLVYPRAAAIAHVESSGLAAPILAKLHWTSAQVVPIDSHLEAVIFYDGPRIVLNSSVTGSGEVLAAVNIARQKVAYGSSVAADPIVLALLAAIFVLMTGVWPLRRLRNLDVLAATGTTIAIVMMNAETPAREIIAAYPALLYLAARCAWRALGPARAPAPSAPLFERLTAGWDAEQRLRVLRLVAIACAVMLTVVGLTSTEVVDVGFAVMQGATAMLHSVLPYGHVPSVLHGDTYPIASYLLYVPLAYLNPVNSPFDSADWALAVAVLAALAAAVMLWRAVRAPMADPDSGAREAREQAGLRTAVAWLSFPPLFVAVSTGTTDLVLAAVLLAALLQWRRPAAAATVLAAGAWFKVYPLLLLPLSLAAARGKQLVRALAGIALVSAAMVAVLVGLGGIGGIESMWHAMSYQIGRISVHSLWAWIGSVPGQQLAQAATIALLAGAAVRIARDRELARDRARIAALCAAVLLGVQIASGYWSYLYLAWILPFLALSVLDAGEGETARP
jgi:hypothetical protein